MSGAASGESVRWRARPASSAGAGAGAGGLWTLLSWLRRDDRSASSDSLSSAGSDRTAASFAFLAPQRQHPPTPATPLPPLTPPTDSYRRRVRDGDQRRQHDRNLTLHRKYGLYYGYDAFSLPPARKNFNESEQDREKRAISESLPRRAAHVPGKRRAPPPPPRAPRPPRPRPHSLACSASLARRTRKRPAPQPPVTSEKIKENIQTSPLDKIDVAAQMNSNSQRDRRSLSNMASDECRSEKHSKKENNTKIRSEKSFLKQIFENKKRSSNVEFAPERILPSISELDRQAAEIIKSCKLMPMERNNNSSDTPVTREETWFCTRCLRRYDSTVVTCHHCLPEQKRLSTMLINNSSNRPSSSVFKGNSSTQTEKGLDYAASTRISGIGADEKQKLKEMLKEMKDSLPKKSKRNNNDKDTNKNIFTFDSSGSNLSSLETPTLRIESKVHKEENIPNCQPSTSKEACKPADTNHSEITNIEKILPVFNPEPLTQNVVITQQIVLVAPQTKESSDLEITKNNNMMSGGNKRKEEEASQPSNVNRVSLNTPLKISSLLNPVYIPKSNPSEGGSPRSIFYSKPSQATVTNNTAIVKSENRTTPLLCNEKNTGIKATPVVVKINAVNANATTENQNLVDNTEKGKVTAKSQQNTSLVTKVTSSSGPIVSTSALTTSEKSKILQSNMVKFTVDQHSRRRELVNQLEQSIAKGDERAAADAAVKLAQLRLSCSVLSYSSQIIAGTSGASQSPIKENTRNTVDTPKELKVETTVTSSINKVNAAVQSTVAVSSNNQIKSKVENNQEKKTNEVLAKTTTNNKQSEQVKTTDENGRQKALPYEPSTSKQITIGNGSNMATIQVWVEDREATRGPVRLRISRQAVMGDLRRQAEVSLGLVSTLQRWIVGRTLCIDDSIPLVSLAGPELSAPFYLCVVETESGGARQGKVRAFTNNKTPDQTRDDKTSDVYSELVQLEQRALVVNAEPFECGICMESCAIGGGAVLRECVHTFCRECLSDLIKHCEEPSVSCPAMGCPGALQEREIRALVTPVEYERWLARGLAAAESGTRNAFHCRTRDCTGWALCDPGVRRFPCPVCKHNNCIQCQAIHEGETCEQYHKKLQEAVLNPTSNQTDEGTRALLDTLISKGEALECPECSAIITKKWGCDWVKCSACKTEICWVTRGRRWGPGGKGDTSGGCRCGVDGKRCHPSCGYCH